MAKSPQPSTDDLPGWLAATLPEQWFVEPPVVEVDKDEIVIVGRLAEPGAGERGDGAGGEDPVARLRRISEFRERTRGQRMAIAEAAQVRWRRTVSWGACCGDTDAIFTHAAVPVMTRLTFEERQVLDTLVDAGVAGSRSEALAWCVRQVAAHQNKWIDRLRQAMSEVEKIRSEGPPPG
jgi:hypothetical protein